MGRTFYYGFGYGPQHNQTYQLKNYNTSYIGYGEVGFSYAYQLNQQLFSNWNFGISIKRLFGVGGTYFHAANSDYNVVNDTTLDIYSLDANLGFAFPSDYDTDEFPSGPWINGKGWAFDLGVEYQALLDRQGKTQATKTCGQKHYDYKYRIGVSLMDIGYINFKNINL